ncbi:UNKNOWN [Stylonychia lemnae]|uniref:Endonuclease/exonuclease/phosphatase domain-containing protein n=1 Tax=Stylonychia lemnae TaxID=5949 RepID=A0A078B4X1_STYLE|nr:UNKNOWN [Stylonychia lemnae]|eukprot:CDW89469.1 UNKNOWN [Stylonychia lemnae]
MNQDNLKQIQTKVHPLNLNLKKKVKNPELFIADRPQNQIKLLTYNIQMIPKSLQGEYQSGYQEERLLDIFKNLGEYDIVCFQEAWGLFQEIKQLLMLYAQKAGFLYVAETRDPNFSSTYLGDAGIMIVSRFYIKKSQSIQYSFGVGNDGWTRRGVLYTQISIGGKEIQDSNGNSKIIDSAILHLFTTHMQSSHFYPTNVAPSTLKQSIVCRTEQCRELSSFIGEQLKQSKLGPTDLVLLTGDMNISGREINPIMTKRLIKENPLFADVIKELYLEYRILTELLSQGQQNTVIDLLRRDNKDHLDELCTFGDYYLNEIGECVPTETVLTVKNEQCFKELLDYIFQIKHNDGPSKQEQCQSKSGEISSKALLRMLPGSTQIQKFFIKGRPYTQTSDHYGISTDIEYLEFDDENDLLKKFD